jgi:hypothetical protein
LIQVRRTKSATALIWPATMYPPSRKCAKSTTSDQMTKVRSPATKKPPSSIDQSPVSNPRSLPSAVKRIAAERNMVDASTLCRSSNSM